MSRTYEECVHQFGMRYLLGINWKYLGSIDPGGLITLDMDVESDSCDTYDYGHAVIELNVPVIGSPTHLVTVENMGMHDVVRAVMAEADSDPPETLEKHIAKSQAERIAWLENELKVVTDAHRAIGKELDTLRAGVSQQTELWECMRNVHRELDLWFNKDMDKVDESVTWAVKTERKS